MKCLWSVIGWLQEFYTWKRKGEKGGGGSCLYKKQPNLYAIKERQEEGDFWIKVQDDMMIGE